jgi:hypothetical protein
MFFVILSRPKCSSTKLVFVSVYNIIVTIFVCRGLCFCMSLKVPIKLSRGFHPITGWFGVNNIIGWVGFNFLLIFLDGCGMDIKVIRFGYGWAWVGFLPLAGLPARQSTFLYFSPF